MRAMSRPERYPVWPVRQAPRAAPPRAGDRSPLGGLSCAELSEVVDARKVTDGVVETSVRGFGVGVDLHGAWTEVEHGVLKVFADPQQAGGEELVAQFECGLPLGRLSPSPRRTSTQRRRGRRPPAI